MGTASHASLRFFESIFPAFLEPVSEFRYDQKCPRPEVHGPAPAEGVDVVPSGARSGGGTESLGDSAEAGAGFCPGGAAGSVGLGLAVACHGDGGIGDGAGG